MPGFGEVVISSLSSSVTGSAFGSGDPGLLKSSGWPVVVAVFGIKPYISAIFSAISSVISNWAFATTLSPGSKIIFSRSKSVTSVPSALTIFS